MVIKLDKFIGLLYAVLLTLIFVATYRIYIFGLESFLVALLVVVLPINIVLLVIVSRFNYVLNLDSQLIIDKLDELDTDLTNIVELRSALKGAVYSKDEARVAIIKASVSNQLLRFMKDKYKSISDFNKELGNYKQDK